VHLDGGATAAVLDVDLDTIGFVDDRAHEVLADVARGGRGDPVAVDVVVNVNVAIVGVAHELALPLY